jgi:phosphoenolpyruvate carboxykinase (GTP)
VFERCDDTAAAVETPIGLLPTPEALDTRGLAIAPDDLRELLRVDVARWKAEIPSIREHYARFGDRLPQGLREELAGLERRLDSAS